jgi:hypothetical protein
MAALGPGTGLGVACLIDRSERPVVIASEAGHATLAPSCEQEDRIVSHLHKRFGHASAERAISGSGLENIYQAVAALEGLELPPLTATEITKRALSGDCELARRSLHAFCAFLGSFAGNVALTFGARGGHVAGLAFVGIRQGFTDRLEDFEVGVIKVTRIVLLNAQLHVLWDQSSARCKENFGIELGRLNHRCLAMLGTRSRQGHARMHQRKPDELRPLSR